MTLSLSTPAPATLGPFIWYVPDHDTSENLTPVEIYYRSQHGSAGFSFIRKELRPVKVDDLRGKM